MSTWYYNKKIGFTHTVSQNMTRRSNDHSYSTITHSGDLNMERFETINEFYRHYEKEPQRITAIEDIDKLIERLRATGHSVNEYKNGTVVVKTPAELETARKQRLMIQMKEAAKYTKLGAAIPIALAHEFSNACRKLGITQSEVLMPIIDETIERANNMASDI